ncbi:MAG: lysophospholipid acyltransferase family protein [Actinomycetota bacterium]
MSERPHRASARPDLVRDDPWWRCALFVVGGLFRLSHRLRIEGLERIPAAGPAILAANHVSPLDPVAIAIAASMRGRTIRYLGAAEVFRIPVIGWVLRRLRQIPLHRGKGDRAAIEDAAGVIASGSLAGIHPEGRLGTGEALLPARRGAARLAIAAGAPLVPIGVWGMQWRWPRGGIKLRRPLRPVAALVIGDPIRPGGLGNADDDIQDLTDRVMRSIEGLIERAKIVAGDRTSL